MLKGVNRQVVEISHPESAYFEKVLFFVKPEFSSVSEKRLRGKADEIIKDAASPPEGKGSADKKGRVKRLLALLAAALTGAAAAFSVSLIF
ncbi:MAG: hypothetical protein E7535_07460 [Ruminococcaceae bacterium]|nr:hypothetical protein [Oscillospiraceae bacterium]